MIGLLAGRADVPADALDLVSEAGIILFGLGWLVAGLSLLTAQPEEGVLGESG